MSLASVRLDFPITYQRAYLNAAAAAPLSNRVVGAVHSKLGDLQLHGRNNAMFRLSFTEQSVRPNVAKLVGAAPSEIAFVKNTTEGLNHVANGLAWKAGDNVVLANIEYPANVYCWLNLARFGVEIRWIDAHRSGGRVTVESIEAATDSRTRLIAISSVQFTNGYRQDLDRTGEFCRKKGILLCYDGIQMVGAFPIEASRHHFDFLVAGGHKWLAGPMGTGLLYIRKEIIDQVTPVNVGPGSVDKHETDIDYDLGALRKDSRRFEEALLNYPGLWGLNASVLTILELGVDNIAKHILEMTGRAADGAKSAGYEVASPLGEGERSGILSFRHLRLKSETVRDCLEAAGVDVTVRQGNIRISPHFYNNMADIEQLVEALPR